LTGGHPDTARRGRQVAGQAASGARALVIIVTSIVLFADHCHIDHQSQRHGSPKLAAD
jgi:hypothetical protein